MVIFGFNDVKMGKKIFYNGDLWVIIEVDFIKLGKGQVFICICICNFKDGCIIEQMLKFSDLFEEVDVVDIDMQLLFIDGIGNDCVWNFMNMEMFEMFFVLLVVMGDVWKWFKGEEECVVILFNGGIIVVQLLKFVELKIVEIDLGVCGDIFGGGGKLVMLEIGVVVCVLLFVNQDEIIKVDICIGEYDSCVGK